MLHKTVLLHEAVDALELSGTKTVFDATFGSGGHAREITQQLGKSGCFIGVDADKTALNLSVLDNMSAQIHLVHDNFVNIKKILHSLHIEKVDAIIADLGWRIEQFTDGKKGFSFMHDGPLHMTFGNPEDYSFTARDIVNGWEEHVLANVFYGYAEERFARRIARAIVEARKKTQINTTTELVHVIEGAIPNEAKHKKTHPATKVFQALRIAVNDELQVLESFIRDGFDSLNIGGKMAIISFHSIEDRVVKHSFRELKEAGLAEINPKKPIVPTQEELSENPRARSAKLRIIKKL